MDKIYTYSLRVFCNCLKHFTETPNSQPQDSLALILKIVEISKFLINQEEFKGEWGSEFEAIMVDFMYEVEQNVEINNPKISE